MTPFERTLLIFCFTWCAVEWFGAATKATAAKTGGCRMVIGFHQTGPVYGSRWDWVSLCSMHTEPSLCRSRAAVMCGQQETPKPAESEGERG